MDRLIFDPAPQVRGDRLKAELAAAGVPVEDVVLDLKDETLEERVLVLTGIDETRRADAQAVISAHSPAPTEAELRPARLREKASQAIVTLENAHANWATLTAAQKDAAIRLSVLVTAKLARLALTKFDVPE